MKKILILFLLGTSVFGQEVITVTTSKVEQELTEEAVVVQTVTTDGSTSALDAIAQQTSLQSKNGTLYAPGWGESGFKSLLILINGVRQSREDMAAFDLSRISADSIERVEVLYGDYTYLYGSGANAGVVNIITKDQSKEEDYRVSTEISAGFPNFDNTLTIFGQSEIGTIIIEHNYDNSFQEDNAYQFMIIEGKGLLPGDDGDYVHFYVRGDRNHLPGGLILSEYNSDPTQSKNADDNIRSLDMGLSVLNTIDFTTLLTSYSFLQNEADTTSYLSYTTTYNHSGELVPTFFFELYPTADIINQLSFGLDNIYDVFIFEKFATEVRDDKTSEVLIHRLRNGLWLKNDIIWDSFILSVGGRIENFYTTAFSETNPDTEGEQNFLGWAANVSGRYDFDHITLGFIGSRGYRYPFIEEQISYYGFGDTFNKDLVPEEYWSGGLFQNITVDPSLTFYFKQNIIYSNNEINYNNATFANENIAETLRASFDLSADLDIFDLFQINNFLNYTYAIDLKTEKELPLAPNISGGATVVATPWEGDHWLKATLVYSSGFFKGGDYDNTGGEIPQRINLSLGYSFNLFEHFRLFGNFNNILNDITPTIAYQGFVEDAYYPEQAFEAVVGIEMIY